VQVLDDGSADDTAAIVNEIARREPRLSLARGQLLLPGWMGKNFACQQLSNVAQGEWLLFTDADTDHRPDTLSWAVAAAQQNQADLVTLVPRTITHTLGERLLLPIIPFGLVGCYPLALGAWLKTPLLPMAVGTFLLFRRETYQRIGGHAAVQGDIAEDVALAREVLRAGGKVVVLDGSDQLDVHFYHGFREAWRGLSKSTFAALGYRFLLTLFLICFYGFLFLWPVMLLGFGLQQGRMNEPALRLALFQVLLNSGLWYAVAVRFHLPRSTALIYPVTILLTILMIFDSIRRTAFGSVGWKGRLYEVRGGELRR
jgi:chlorobactene glucosyltransferase